MSMIFISELRKRVEIKILATNNPFYHLVDQNSLSNTTSQELLPRHKMHRASCWRYGTLCPSPPPPPTFFFFFFFLGGGGLLLFSLRARQWQALHVARKEGEEKLENYFPCYI